MSETSSADRSLRSPLVVLAVDQSLTCSGLAMCGPAGTQVWRLPTRLTGHPRLSHIVGHVLKHAELADVVALEGLAYGAKGSALLDLAGLLTLLRHELWQAGKPYVVIDPASRAKFITGSGSAHKDECLLATARRFPTVPLAGNDDADALVLCAMTAQRYGHPLVPMPADRVALLTAVHTAKGKQGKPKIIWPELHLATA